MNRTSSRLPKILTLALLALGVEWLASSPALALNGFLKTWNAAYPQSASGNADCALCHGSSTSNLNGYGKDLCLTFGASVPADVTDALRSIEALDSDGDSNANLAEIEAHAQPGWTAGENALYALSDAGCAPIGSTVVPSGVPLPYDPPVAGDPVAVPGGPYSGYPDAPITFDGGGSYDSDGGAIVAYAWDFGDGATGEGAVVQHAYAAAGTYPVTLTVVDDEGATDTASTSVPVAAGALLDLDVSLKVTSTQRVGRPVSIQLVVENPGTVNAQALASVVGMQDGVRVYAWTLNVYDFTGKGTTTFDFPAYTPAATGVLAWTATVADADPDVDSAAATTVVR